MIDPSTEEEYSSLKGWSLQGGKQFFLTSLNLSLLWSPENLEAVTDFAKENQNEYFLKSMLWSLRIYICNNISIFLIHKQEYRPLRSGLFRIPTDTKKQSISTCIIQLWCLGELNTDIFPRRKKRTFKPQTHQYYLKYQV